MKKEVLYFAIFVFFQIAYAVRSAPYDMLSGSLLVAGLIVSVMYLKLEVLAKRDATHEKQ